jgi:glucose/arabinose dehydrogenase
VLPGHNYGWPVITYGMNYDGTPITGITAKKGMDQPVIYWQPSIAACGLSFYRGDKFPKWKNDLFAGALAQQEIRRLQGDLSEVERAGRHDAAVDDVLSEIGHRRGRGEAKTHDYIRCG